MAKVETLVGNGLDTQYDVSAGFNTSVVAVRCFDLSRGGNEVFAFGLEKQTPDSTSVRVSLNPAPGTNTIRVVVTDGTEIPE